MFASGSPDPEGDVTKIHDQLKTGAMLHPSPAAQDPGRAALWSGELENAVDRFATALRAQIAFSSRASGRVISWSFPLWIPTMPRPNRAGYELKDLCGGSVAGRGKVSPRRRCGAEGSTGGFWTTMGGRQ
jgi:hypothetical protein